MQENNLIIALLIDTENVSMHYMERVEQSLIAMGKITYKRMYGDFTKASSSSWKEIANTYSLTPVQQYSYTQGKNSTDSRMVIDAMDILYSGNVNAMCIMSSDSDFTGLVRRLKESNVFVIGAGESKTPQSFVKACDRFFILNEDKTEPKAETGKKKQTAEKAEPQKSSAEKKSKPSVNTVKVVKKSQIEQFVTRLLESKNEDECALEWVLSKIVQAFPQFEVKDYGVKKSYEFFDKKKFKLTQTSNANWVISLK